MLAGLLGGLIALDRSVRLTVPSPYRIAPAGTLYEVYAAIAIAAVVAALAPARARRGILLVAGAVATAFALGTWAIILVAYVAVAIVLARLRAAVPARCALAVAAWATVPVMRVRFLDGVAQAETILLAELWVGMLYATLFLIVERARALPGEASTVVDDAFYLLAPPRLVMPFFQPISPRRLLRAQRDHHPRRLLARGAGLAGYAIVVAIAAHRLELVEAHVTHEVALAIAFVVHYARAANAILLATAAFRLLGFDVPSGFDLPFLSRSFADFFRRYNHYVRDAVVSLFYLPILGHLRTRLPHRPAAMIAGFAGILVGAFALQDLLIPCAISIAPAATLAELVRPDRLAAMIVFWVLIVVPNAGLVARRREESRARTVARIVVVDAIYAALWYVGMR